MLLDVLTLDLPTAIVKFVEISEKCREVCESIITHMCECCSPRDMMFALSEVIIFNSRVLYFAMYVPSFLLIEM